MSRRNQWGEEKKPQSKAATIVHYLIFLAIFAGGSAVALTKYHDTVAIFYGWAVLVATAASAIFVLFCFFTFLFSSVASRLVNLPKLGMLGIAVGIFAVGIVPLLHFTDGVVRPSLRSVLSECSIPPIYWTLSGATPPSPKCCPFDAWGIRRDGKRAGSEPPIVPLWCCEPRQADGLPTLTEKECKDNKTVRFGDPEDYGEW